jgi:heme/copper-type cytochrome/quinol oxidase subunit 2
MQSNFGKWFIYAGLALVLVGCLIWLGNKFGISFGKLPGDIQIQKEKFSFYFPIVTSIIASILLTLILNLIFWLMKK